MAKAKLNDKGIDELISSISKVSNNRSLQEIAGTAVYAMADKVADAIKQNLNGLMTEEEEPWKGHRSQYLSQRQKDGLVQSFGIAPMRAEGDGWNVRLGFDGYNAVKTEMYPSGQPNIMIARAVESGSLYMRKQPFFRPAVNAARAAAKKAGEDAVMAELEKQL